MPSTRRGPRPLKIVSVAAAAACLCLAVPAAAQDAGDSPQAPPTAAGVEQPVPEPSAAALRRMHLINQFEIRAGEMAMERGTTDRIRALGERLMRDHRVADDRVASMAAELNVSLPSVDLQAMMEKPKGELTDAQQMLTSSMANLRRADGETFDAAYLEAMRKTHRRAIEMLNGRLEAIEVGAVHALVENVIPILGQHRDLTLSILEERNDEPQSPGET